MYYLICHEHNNILAQTLNYVHQYVPKGTTYFDKTIRIDKNPIKTALNVCKHLISKRVYAVVVSHEEKDSSGHDLSPAAVSYTSGFYQIPVIGISSRDAAFSDKNIHVSFLRTVPPYYHQADVWLEMLSHFGYTKACNKLLSFRFSFCTWPSPSPLHHRHHHLVILNILFTFLPSLVNDLLFVRIVSQHWQKKSFFFLLFSLFAGDYNSQFRYRRASDIRSLSNDIANKLRRHRCSCECGVNCGVWAEAGELCGASGGAADGAVPCLSAVCEVRPE